MTEIQNSNIENAIGWMLEKKADDVKFFDVRNKTDYTDYVIVATGTNELHIRAIANHVLEKAKENNMLLVGKEGFTSASWVLLDFGDIVVHITLPEARELYKLDTLFEEIQQKRIETEQ
jgi:ribosome-associated protein